MPVPPSPGAPPTDELVDAFLNAAAMGGEVWAWDDRGKVRVSTRPPGPAATPDTARLLATALREVFGRSAARAAEDDLARSAPAQAASLPATLVRRVVQSAEAASSLLQGASYALRLRYSALAGGAGFRACCRELGIDAEALPAERRQAIDTAVAARVDAAGAVDAETVAAALREALQTRLH